MYSLVVTILGPPILITQLIGEVSNVNVVIKHLNIFQLLEGMMAWNAPSGLFV